MDLLEQRAKNVSQEQWLNGAREGADWLSWSDSPQRAEEPAAPHSYGQSIPRKSHLMGARRKSRKRSSEPKYDRRAGEELRTEMHHMREGEHPVKNRRQALR